MPDPALLERLRSAVAANFASEIEFLADLVRFPSTRGNEAPLQDWMARQLAARGSRDTLELAARHAVHTDADRVHRNAEGGDLRAVVPLLTAWLDTHQRP